MTAPEPTAAPQQPVVDRAELIDALSWAEDMERGRWGTEYAAAVLDAHDARVHADLLAELEELRAYAATAHGPEAWASAMGEILRLHEEVAADQKAAASPRRVRPRRWPVSEGQLRDRIATELRRYGMDRYVVRSRERSVIAECIGVVRSGYPGDDAPDSPGVSIDPTPHPPADRLPTTP